MARLATIPEQPGMKGEFDIVYYDSSFEAGRCIRCGRPIYDSKYDKCTDCEHTG